MAHSLIPVHNNGGLIYNVSFFNDQDAFYYEFDINCTLYDQYRSYNFGKDYCQDPSVNSSVSLLEKSWNITKGLLKRDGNVKDIIESYKSKKVGNLKNEFESTIDETLKSIFLMTSLLVLFPHLWMFIIVPWRGILTQ